MAIRLAQPVQSGRYFSGTESHLAVIHRTGGHGATHQQETLPTQHGNGSGECPEPRSTCGRATRHRGRDACHGALRHQAARAVQDAGSPALSRKHTRTCCNGSSTTGEAVIAHRQIESLGLGDITASDADVVETRGSCPSIIKDRRNLAVTHLHEGRAPTQSAPKPLITTVWSPSRLPASSLEMVKGTEALLVLPYLWMQ